MAYVGRGLTTGAQYQKLDTISIDDATTFTMQVGGTAVTPAPEHLILAVNGVIQEPNVGFTLSGSTCTLASAIDNDGGSDTIWGMIAGDAAYAAVTALNNATANVLVTVGSTTTELDAEANLTFDGTDLSMFKDSENTEFIISAYHNTGATTPQITLRKGDNTQAEPALVDDDDVLGTISFQGYDGSGFEQGAKIEARIDGTPSDGTDLPTELTFWTTPDASATAVQRMTIGQTGNVGIGTTDTSAWHLTVKDSANQFTAKDSNDDQLLSVNDGVVINEDGGDRDFRVEGVGDANALFVQGSDGHVGLGRSTLLWWKFMVESAGNGEGVANFINTGDSTPSGVMANFTAASPDNNTNWFYAAEDSTESRFIIYSDGDIVNHDNSYGQISDERIKQDIRDANSQWDDIKGLRVRNFKRKDDVFQYGDNAWEQIGLVAQETEQVSPYLVEHSPPSEFEMEHCGFGEHDEDGEWVVKKDESGKDMQVKSMKYSILYMKAVKALQEAMERIEGLETKVEALENA